MMCARVINLTPLQSRDTNPQLMSYNTKEFDSRPRPRTLFACFFYPVPIIVIVKSHIAIVQPQWTIAPVRYVPCGPRNITVYQSVAANHRPHRNETCAFPQIGPALCAFRFPTHLGSVSNNACHRRWRRFSCINRQLGFSSICVFASCVRAVQP